MKKLSTTLTTSADAQAISHKNLRSRFGTAFVAGCLALSLCPALAFAAPGDDGGQGPQGGNPPAMQQGQAPSGEAPSGEAPSGEMPEMPSGEAPSGEAPEAVDGEMPSGQAPNGQNGQMPGQPGQNGQPGQQGNDATSDQITKILSETYGVTLPSFDENSEGAENGQSGQPGKPGMAPTLAEGEVNVQAVIDSARDILSKYSAEDLEANLSDEDYAASVLAYAKQAAADRAEMFASGEKPTEGQKPASDSTEAPAAKSSASSSTASDSVMSSLVEMIYEMLGYTTTTSATTTTTD